MMDRSSFTAETMALQRAFESHGTPQSRLFVDQYADAFVVNPVLSLVVRASRLRALHRPVIWLYDLIAGAFPRTSAIVRTRIIDDEIIARARTTGQVVILGAGFDCRAHRLESLANHRVFEVDHPATQTSKRAIAEQIGLRHPITYVPVDFEREDIADRLMAEGFDRQLPTIFVWEGVTNYLTASAVDHTIRTIEGLSAPDSSLIFTYVHRGVFDGSVHFPEAKRWLQNVRRAGEPWTFGFDPTEVKDFLAARGFVLESNVSTAEAGESLFAERRRCERASALYFVATCRSNRHPSQ